MKQKLNIFWFRRDLRLHDNAGLLRALSAGLPVLPVFVFDKIILDQLEDDNDRRVSFIYRSLQEIQQQLLEQQSTLDVRYGLPLDIFTQLNKDYKIDSVFTNHDYEPYAVKRDDEIAKYLSQNEISFITTKDQVIFEKNEIIKPQGEPYKIYTPYYNNWIGSLSAKDYELNPSENLLHNFFTQSEKLMPALKEMQFVFNEHIPNLDLPGQLLIQNYHQTRNIPGVVGTSRMGVHLRFGTVSVRQLVNLAINVNETYLKELVWREFFMQMLWHYPRNATQACKTEYENIEWRNNENEFESWCKGETGYPIVDAGMRELNETGFMHNRVRMVVASFLIKDLLIDWKWGEAYFARKLLDYDLASNNGNWQWVAGCGCDLAPYFRIFNPSLQAVKFDKEEKYIKQWVPEYGTDLYVKQMIDHKIAKERCLIAYKKAVH